MGTVSHPFLIMDSIYYSEEIISGIKITALASSDGIRKIFLNSQKKNSELSSATKLHSNDPYLFNVFNQLKEYFDGKRKKFDIPLDIKGTDFQKRVWNELQKIPYGKTISYKKLSEKLGDVKAIRAVGKANGQNPIPIIIPCHRVIGADGELTGYAGGLEVKEKLLEIEGSRSLELFE
jgi:methylated-DNA-[protein]-cysteine S-methyltransferase